MHKSMLLIVSMLLLTSRNLYSQPNRFAADLKQHIVRIQIEGERTGGDRSTRSKTGTGFYVSNSGFILTAGHVLSPFFLGIDDRSLGPKTWDADSPRITVTHPGASANRKTAALIYIDEQVDLGLIKTESRGKAGSLQLGVYSDLQSSQTVYAYAFGANRGVEVDIRQGTVDATAGLGSNGRADVHIVGVGESDSGSPIVNEEGRVIAVLSMGDPAADVGRVAIPIPFATPMLARVEIKNAEEEERMLAVDSVIQEMRTEVSNFSATLSGDYNNSSLSVEFDKRLEAGYAPDSVDVEISLVLRGNVQPRRSGVYATEVKEFRTRGRGQEATLPNISQQVSDRIGVINDQSAANDQINLSEVERLIIRPTVVWSNLVVSGQIDSKEQKGQDFEFLLSQYPNFFLE